MMHVVRGYNIRAPPPCAHIAPFRPHYDCPCPILITGAKTCMCSGHQSLRHPSMIYEALSKAGWGVRRERIRPNHRDSHGGRSGEYISHACIARQHYAIDSNTDKPFMITHQEARGADAAFKGLRAHSTHRGEETGGQPLSREGATLLSMCAPHWRPLMALPRRFCSCTGASVLQKSPGAYTRVCGLNASHKGHAGAPRWRAGLPT